MNMNMNIPVRPQFIPPQFHPQAQAQFAIKGQAGNRRQEFGWILKIASLLLLIHFIVVMALV